MLKVHDEHSKSSKQTNITQVSWPLTHCLEKHSIFYFTTFLSPKLPTAPS